MSRFGASMLRAILVEETGNIELWIVEDYPNHTPVYET